MTPTRDPIEVKTRELPRPVVKARGLPSPWTSSAPGQFALVTREGCAFVSRVDGEVTVTAGDSREVLRHLATLLEWAAWVPPCDGRAHSSLCEVESAG